MPCAGCVCVPGVCRQCAGCVPVCWSGVCGLCGLCLSNVPGMCWSGVWCGVWWVCAGLCRPSVLEVWGVPGVCRECARCVLREHAWVVLRVCGVCAGSVPGVCGRAWVGGVPGVCRVVCWVRWGCAMQGIQRGVCRSVRVCRERVPDVGCAGVCRVCAGSVRVCRVCAGVFVGAVWPVLEQ